MDVACSPDQFLSQRSLSGAVQGHRDQASISISKGRMARTDDLNQNSFATIA
jgi:hypothetical protein